MDRERLKVVSVFNEVLNDLEEMNEIMTPSNRVTFYRILKRMKNRLVLLQDEVRYGDGRIWDSENRGNQLDLSKLCGEDTEGESPTSI
jgi:hypothetical protein